MDIEIPEPISLTFREALAVLGRMNMIAKASERAKSEGAWRDNSDNTTWWLGSFDHGHFAYMVDEGGVEKSEHPVSLGGVRPAFIYDDTSEEFRKKFCKQIERGFIINSYTNKHGNKARVAIAKHVVGWVDYHSDTRYDDFKDTNLYTYEKMYTANKLYLFTKA